MFKSITHRYTQDKLQTFWAMLVVLIFAIILLYIDLSPVGEQQFSYLADSFLHGKLYFLDEPGSWTDTAPYNGKNFWPLGPFPAVILMPFVFIFSLAGKFFHQGYMQPFLVAGVFYCVFRFARSFDYSIGDSIFWAFGFTFSSVFLNVMLYPWSWWFAQVLTELLIWVGLWEFFHKKRFLLLGSIVGLLLLTRLPASLLGVLFVIDILFPYDTVPIRHKIKMFSQFAIPLLIAISAEGLYNYLRFDNFLETGYLLQIPVNDSLEGARQYGLTSILHVPGNLYYLLISMPLPVFKEEVSHVLQFPYITANPWGMSIFVTSPYFLLLFLYKYTDRTSRQLLFSSMVISIPIILYFGIGYRQFGYRYSLDFLPLLYLLLMDKYRQNSQRMSIRLKTILIMTATSNLFFFKELFINL